MADEHADPTEPHTEAEAAFVARVGRGLLRAPSEFDIPANQADDYEARVAATAAANATAGIPDDVAELLGLTASAAPQSGATALSTAGNDTGMDSLFTGPSLVATELRRAMFVMSSGDEGPVGTQRHTLPPAPWPETLESMIGRGPAAALQAAMAQVPAALLPGVVLAAADGQLPALFHSVRTGIVQQLQQRAAQPLLRDTPPGSPATALPAFDYLRPEDQAYLLQIAAQVDAHQAFLESHAAYPDAEADD